MTTRYTYAIENTEGLGPTISTDELHELGRNGALELFRKRWRQRQRNLLNPTWQHGRSFPGHELQVSSPGTARYIEAYQVLNRKRCLTYPGFVNCNGEILA